MTRPTVWIHDLAGVRIDAIAHGFVELYTDERLDQSDTLTLTIPATHPKAARLTPDVELAYDGRRYWIGEPEFTRTGTTTLLRVEAEALWYRLGDDVYVGSLVLDAATPAEGIAAILDGTSWTVDDVATASAETFSTELQDLTRLELLRRWASVCGLHLRFDTAGRTVSLVSTPGADLGLSFRYGRNITGIRKREAPPRTTRLYAFGADDLTIAGVNGGDPYVEDFTYYTDQGIDLDVARERFTKSRVWVDTAFVRDADLLAAAETRLAAEAAATLSYEIDVVDLTERTEIPERSSCGDTARVYDPAAGDDLRLVISRLVRHPLQPWRNEIELATVASMVSDGSSPQRAQRSQEWTQFVGPVGGDYQIRNDGAFTVARIPLRFRDGGRANFHLDLEAVGVGAGTAHVEVYDATLDEVVYRTIDAAYTDAQPVRFHLSWAAEELTGSHDYRVRVTTTATGGPSTAAGLNITADPSTLASWWILAQGAIQETPTAPNSAVYEFVGYPETFVVPDNVSEVTVIARGAGGGDAGIDGGGGGEVSARFPVTPGQTLHVVVGGNPGGSGGNLGTQGWPNGGRGSTTGIGGGGGAGGGGSSHVLRSLSEFSSALIVAAGGGGRGALGLSRGSEEAEAGAGEFYQGGDGNNRSGGPGAGGGSQYAGGAAGVENGLPGFPGTFGQGGNAADTPSSFAFGGGGGGGGWYGGGGSGPPATYGGGSYGGDGGGGSGYLDPSATDVTIIDGASTGDGRVEFQWETPA